MHLAIVAGFIVWAGVAGLASGQPPSSPRDVPKFTEVPARKTEAAQRLIDQARAALESGKSPTAILTAASFLPVHEWPRFRELIRDAAQRNGCLAHLKIRYHRRIELS